MVYFRTIIAAAMLLVSAITAAPALAQGAIVLVYDQERVVTQSKANADIATKVQAIGEQMERELEPERNALESEGKALEARTQNLNREQIAADAVLTGQIEAFARKSSEYQLKEAVRSQELQITQRTAANELVQMLGTVLDTLVKEREADVLLERSSIAYASEKVDVTAEVLSRLDTQLPSVTVTRARLTDEQQQQLQQQLIAQQQQLEQRALQQTIQQQQLAQRGLRQLQRQPQ